MDENLGCSVRPLAALARVESGESGAEQSQRRRLGRRLRRSSEDLKADAVVEEVAVGVEAQSEVAAVRDVVEERGQLRGREIVNEVRGRRRERLRSQERVRCSV